MHKTNSIIMQASRAEIFETAANLENWPKILPHYRYIKYLERDGDRNVVIMAATRSGIPISWTSEQIIDREKIEVRFHHLKAFTKGMFVVWTFRETPAGVLVENGIPREGAFPFNHAFTVAPTSANSPLWMRPAAL